MVVNIFNERCGMIFCKLQSVSSNKKSSSTFFLKSLAILSASTVDGTYLLLSMALMVCRDTPIFSAKSCCVIFKIALSTLMVFFMLNGLVK